MKYRLLKVGELIRKGDQVCRSNGKWYKTILHTNGYRVGSFAGRYRRKLPRDAVKQSFSVTISRSNTDKIFKLAKGLSKCKVEWFFEPFVDEFRKLLKALRRLEKETLGGAK